MQLLGARRVTARETVSTRPGHPNIALFAIFTSLAVSADPG